MSHSESFFSVKRLLSLDEFKSRALRIACGLAIPAIILTLIGSSSAFIAMLILIGACDILLGFPLAGLLNHARRPDLRWIGFVPVINLGLVLYVVFDTGRPGVQQSDGSERRVESGSGGPPREPAQRQGGSEGGSRGVDTVSRPPHRKSTDTRPPTPPSAPRLPPPLRIGYDPSYSNVWGDAREYPSIVLPKKNSLLVLPRHERGSIKGYCEENFIEYIRTYFSGRFEITDVAAVALGSRTRAAEPDIVVFDPDLRLFLDIEIDEPYSGRDRIPIHCLEGGDLARDEELTRRGWIVARFAEIQVHKAPTSCCRVIADLLSELVTDFSIPDELREIDFPFTVVRWDELQARRWEEERYRETYLDIRSFGEKDESEVVFVEELKPEEAAAQDILDQEWKSNTTPRGPSGFIVRVPALPPRNYHPRDGAIRFDDETHRYYINGNPETRSVTELVSAYYPAFDARRVADKVCNDPRSPHFGRDPSDVACEWEEIGRKAREDGKRLHKLIERHLCQEPIDEVPPEFEQYLSFRRQYPHLSPFRTEWRIYDEYLMIAGTVDALLTDTGGSVVMVDWKRTSKLKRENSFASGRGPLQHLPDANYFKYALQQNIYAHILRRHYDIAVDRMYLLVLHPRQTKFELVDIDRMPDETDALLGPLSSRTLLQECFPHGG